MDDQIREALEQEITEAFEAKLFLGNRALVRVLTGRAREHLRKILDRKNDMTVVAMAVSDLQGLVDVYDEIVRAAEGGDYAAARLEQDRRDRLKEEAE